MSKQNLSGDEKDELQRELTSVASRRVTYDHVVHLAQLRAASFFNMRKDELAKEFRSFAEEIDIKRREASEAQDKLLKQLGYR